MPMRRTIMPTREEVLEALKECYDPEIPINIVDLGLVYGVEVDNDTGVVDVEMTLTSVGCPMAEEVIAQVEEEAGKLDGVKDVRVELVWYPLWSPEMASDDGKGQLAIMGIPVY
jgi:metal-sulfur cluster biosynthetic enzyme